MIVRLNHAQGRVVTTFIGGRHAELMVEHRTSAGRKHHLYVLPAIAWRQIFDRMYLEAFGPRGGKRSDRPRSFHTALSIIQAEIATREHHPALELRGIMGVSTEIVPAWKGDIGRYSPYPIAGGEFELLTPRTSEVSGHAVTEWSAAEPDFWQYPWHPDTHLDFVHPGPS